MTEPEADLIIRRIYWLALGFGLAGIVIYFGLQGWRPAAGFALGALGSIGNLWLFEWLTRSIVPAPGVETPQKPWQAGIFVTRYIVMILVGYAIVKTLGVNALAVILGLLTSTAAVLTSTVLEVLQNFFVSRSSH
jgi:phage-related protein